MKNLNYIETKLFAKQYVNFNINYIQKNMVI